VIRLLFSDVDRTLLTRGYELLPDVSRAVGVARQAGIEVVLATARPPMAVRRYARALGVARRCICLNGAWVGDVESGIGESLGAIQPQVVKRIVEWSSCEAIDTVIYTAHAIFTTRLTPAIEVHSNRTGEEVMQISNLDEITTPILKILCVSAPARALESFDTLRGLLDPTVHAAQSRIDLLEINSVAVSKGNAAEHLARGLGLESTEWAAIGDGENDISLLRRASLRLTVDNAIPEIKRIAALHFSSCDAGGFAEAMAYIRARNAAELCALNEDITTQ
jgi:Cof subfamily protein (haloacid dehalogenase superfamily)